MKKQNKISVAGKVISGLLLVSFITTIMVPLTGVQIHKIASVLFLLLTVIHAIIYSERLAVKKYFMLIIVFIAFVCGIFGMVMEQYPIIMQLHKATSIASVFFLAIHIFVYHKKITVK